MDIKVEKVQLKNAVVQANIDSAILAKGEPVINLVDGEMYVGIEDGTDKKTKISDIEVFNTEANIVDANLKPGKIYIVEDYHSTGPAIVLKDDNTNKVIGLPITIPTPTIETWNDVVATRTTANTITRTGGKSLVVGSPVKYTDNVTTGTWLYGVVKAISGNVCTIGGPDIPATLASIKTADVSRVIKLQFFCPGKFETATDLNAILKTNNREFFKWDLGLAYIAEMSVKLGLASTAQATTARVMLGAQVLPAATTATFYATETVKTFTPLDATNKQGVLTPYGDLEISAMLLNSASHPKDSEDLSVALLVVLE